MTQDDRFSYRVQRGEKVTLVAKLRNLPSDAVGVGLPMKREPGQGDPTFSFVIPANDNQRIYDVVAEVDFVMPQTGAQAVITLEGDKGGGEFKVMTIKASSPLKDPGFTFWVRE